MKILIYFSCFFLNGLITVFLKKNMGISLGAIPTVGLYLLALTVARSLCRKWDERKKASKKEIKKDVYFKQCDEKEDEDESDGVIHKWRCSKCSQMITKTPCRFCGYDPAAVPEGKKKCVLCGTVQNAENNTCEKCGSTI